MSTPFLFPAARRPEARRGNTGGGGGVGNLAPTAIFLSGSIIDKDAAAGTVIGELTVLDPGETRVTYLVSDARFTIASANPTAKTANLVRGLSGTLPAGNYSVNITAVDSAGNSYTEAKVITSYDPTAEALLFSEAMVGTGAPADTVHVFAQQFAQGRVPTGVNVVCKVDGAKIRTQFEVNTTWPDGSCKDALMAIEIPFIAASAVKDLEFWTGVHPSPGANINLSTALVGRSASVNITPTSGTPWNYDLIANLPTARVRNGPLVSEVRYRLAVPSASFSGSTAGGCWLNMWVTKDGALFIDSWVINFRWLPNLDTGGALASLAFTVTIDGNVALSKSTTGMARSSGSVRYLRGRKLGSTVDVPQFPVFLRPNINEWVNAGICLLYDTSQGVASSLLSLVQSRLANSTFWDVWTTNGTRNPLRGLIDSNPTGDNENVYGIPFDDASAAYVVGGHTDFLLYTVGRAEAMGASQHFTWVKTVDRWPNADDLPGVRVFGDDIYTAQSFADDRAHHPMCEPLACLMTGRDILRESHIGYCHTESMDGYEIFEGCRTWSRSDRQLRTGGYTTACMAIARIFMKPDHYSSRINWLDRSMAANLNFQRAWLVEEQSRFGQTWGRFRHTYDPTSYPPWHDDLWTLALCLMAQQGFTNALDTIVKRGNFQWGGFLQTGTRWPLNMISYDLPASVSGAGTEFTTWSALISYAAGYVPIQSPLEKDAMYCRLRRACFAAQARLLPSNTTLQSAISAFDAVGYRGYSVPELQAAPKQNIRRPPGYAVPGP